MDEEIIIREYGDASRLMKSIREDTRQRIDILKEQTQNEILKAEKEYACEIQSFKDAQKGEIDAAIDNAIYIIKNRAAIEKRKLHLNAVEDFIQMMVNEAVSDFIMNNLPGYLSFLKKIIINTLSSIQGNDIVIHLYPEDASLESEIRDFIIQNNVYNENINFITDTTISTGGVILENRREGVSYNLSMERIISRKNDTIRKEVVKIVGKYVQPAS